ncbi:MAG TPA: redoxin domain-containing protein [Acidimicrobiales bacterium]|nr:redoxin domain-containing protein [Acidimicrobiales bacterium]
MTDTVGTPPGGVPPDETPPAGAGGANTGTDTGAVEGDDLPRRSRTGKIVSAVVAVLLLGFVAVLATREPASERRADSPLVGRTVPALAGPTIDGGSFDIDDHAGRWVVVNFFATWCQPCRQEHPQLKAFDEEHRTLGDVAVVSVPYRDADENIREYFADNGGDWPVLVNDDGRAAVDFGVVKVPETYLVDPTGQVVAKFVGGVTQAGMDDVILDYERGADAAAGSGT